jgi:hypothetical protein
VLITPPAVLLAVLVLWGWSGALGPR